MTVAASLRPPLSPKEGWLIHGRQVLRLRPTRWERQVQRLEITSSELLPDHEIPMLKKRQELSRAGKRQESRKHPSSASHFYSLVKRDSRIGSLRLGRAHSGHYLAPALYW
jgi:hypothetical protein